MYSKFRRNGSWYGSWIHVDMGACVALGRRDMLINAYLSPFRFTHYFKFVAIVSAFGFGFSASAFISTCTQQCSSVLFLQWAKRFATGFWPLSLSLSPSHSRTHARMHRPNKMNRWTSVIYHLCFACTVELITCVSLAHAQQQNITMSFHDVCVAAVVVDFFAFSFVRFSFRSQTVASLLMHVDL